MGSHSCYSLHVLYRHYNPAGDTCLGELGPAKTGLRDSLARISNKRNALQVPHNKHGIQVCEERSMELEIGLLG